jgi:hypothetical protein
MNRTTFDTTNVAAPRANESTCTMPQRSLGGVAFGGAGVAVETVTGPDVEISRSECFEIFGL